MFVSQASRKYDALKVAASNPPRHASWRPGPREADPTLQRFYVITMKFAEWEHPSGRVERVLVNPGYTIEQLESTSQFWQADEED